MSAGMVGAGKALVGGFPLAVLNEISGAVAQLIEVHEQESTKRENIRARERVLISEIRSKSELFLTYLDRAFDERRDNFQRLFDLLDTALVSNSSDVAGILGAITDLATKSPFADLADIKLIEANLSDPDHEWVA